MPNGTAAHLYGMHDWSQDWAALVKSAAKTAWCVITLEIKDDPNDFSGQDFTHIADQGITVIGRLNYSHHGEGTIPKPDRYQQFAVRCRNFVAASKGCNHWVIGNEPNLNGETPGGLKIMPEDYARCFKMCRDQVKSVSTNHQVITAGVAPYNVDNLDWITYWSRMLVAVEIGGADGIGLHTYSRGPNPLSIISSDKMDPPYQEYHNGFQAYKDFLAHVPVGMRSLYVYITETDQNVPWLDANSGWVRAAYAEIDKHNRSGAQPIRCLVLYRWSTDDQWQISPKRGVIDDFYQTMRETSYLSPIKKNGSTVHLPQVEAPLAPPYVKVVTPAGANIRKGPGVAYPVVTAVVNGTRLKATGKNQDGTWYRVEGPFGTGWVSATVLQVPPGLNVPVVPATTTPVPDGGTPTTMGKDWLISAWSRVLGIDERVVKAVLVIESGGRGFEGDRMIIRFENHRFHANLKRLAPQLEGTFYLYFKYGSPAWTGHYWRPNVDTPWDQQHNGGQVEEWQVLNFARTIHEEAAMLSISMGSAQILGENHRTVGYSRVQEMFQDYNTPGIGEYNQLVGFFAYVNNVKGLLQAFKDKDWVKIAASYNGSGQAEYYGGLIRQKYMDLGGK